MSGLDVSVRHQELTQGLGLDVRFDVRVRC